MRNDERALVTGGLGYIGSAVKDALLAAHLECLSVDKRTDSAGDCVALDLCERDATAALFQSFKPTVVVHAGAHSAVAYREKFFESFTEDFNALHALLEALRGSQTKLIYFSSNYVYSGCRGDGSVTEATKLLPSHNFGVGKAFFEQYILRNHPESVIFRLSSVFGEGPAQHPNALQVMANEARTDGKVTVWGNGARMMQYIYLPDVVRFTLAAPAMKPGIYNLGGDEYISVADTAGIVAGFFRAEAVFLREKTEGETLPRMDTSSVRNAAPKEKFTPFPKAATEYLSRISARAA